MEIFLLVVLVFGLALLAVPLSARLPEEGLTAWIRSAFGSMREPVGKRDDGVEVDIEDLLDGAEEGTGYISPGALRDRVTQVRDDLTRR